MFSSKMLNTKIGLHTTHSRHHIAPPQELLRHQGSRLEGLERSRTFPYSPYSLYRMYTLFNTVQHVALYKTVHCTVVQSFSSEQEIDHHMCHMSTFWSGDSVSCQSLLDHHTSKLLANKSKISVVK